MKILFVAPLQDDANVQNYGAPHLGFMRIDSYLKSQIKDLDITIFDPQIDFYDPLEKFKNDKVDILGISVLHYTLVNTLSFIHRWKKEHPESLIISGGNESSANYQDIFDKSPCDIAVLAEGEQTMLDIVLWKLGKKNFEEISGIVYRKYAEPITDNALWNYWKNVDFSRYRYPEFWKQTARLYENPENYLQEINTVRLVTSSHCNRSCTFCSLALCRTISSGQYVKPASLEGWQIMELNNKIKKQLPDTKTIYYVTDDVYYPNKDRFFDFIDLYKQSGYDYRILVQSSSYSLNEISFQALKRLGCSHITVGIENASPKIRSSLKKPQDENKIEEIITWSKKYKIPVYFLIILIPPESTLEDLKVNYFKIKYWISQGVKISIEPLCYVYRGTPLYEDDRYDFLWKRKKIEGTNLYYKDSIYVLPRLPLVRKLAIEFKEREPEFVKRAYEKLNHKHRFKGSTSTILNDLLGELLREYGILA